MKKNDLFELRLLSVSTSLNDHKLFMRYFLNYDPTDWQEGSGDGLFHYYEDGETCSSSLIIHENPKYGIGLIYNNDESTGNYSVGNKTLMNQFVYDGNEILHPLGTYLSPQEAWLGVVDFLEKPKEFSKRINWMNSSEIEWDESLF